MVNEKLCIIGDSFCAHRTNLETDWPCILSKKLYPDEIEIPLGKGFQGASWWSARKLLYKFKDENVFDNVDTIILLHTEPYRIPSEHHYPLNSNSVIRYSQKQFAKTQRRAVPPQVLLAANYFYKYLELEEFQMWAMDSWCKELDEFLVRFDSKKILHLFCFSLYNDYRFKTGVTVKTPLYTIAKDNIKKEHSLQEDDEIIRNHFTIKQNFFLANQLYALIDNYTTNRIIELNIPYENRD